MAMRWRRDGVL